MVVVVMTAILKLWIFEAMCVIVGFYLSAWQDTLEGSIIVSSLAN